MIQLKHFYRYWDESHNQYTVNIYDDSDSIITMSGIGGEKQPCVINYALPQDYYQPVLTAAGNINITSSGNYDYANLFTPNMFKYRIKKFKNSNLIFSGFLDSEMYQEDFVNACNYPVQFRINDGFNLLKRIKYLDPSGNTYQGIESYWTIFTRILKVLDLNCNYLLFSSSTSISGETLAANETIFHRMYVQNANFVDEEQKPQTMRDVLESLLKSCYLYIKQDIDGNLVVNDINNQLNSSSTYKKYEGSDFTYVSTITRNNFLGDISETGLKIVNNSNHSLSTVTAYNKQVLTYKPYIPALLDWQAGSGSFTGLNNYSGFGSDLYTWNEYYYTTSDSFNKTNSNASFCKAMSTAGSTSGNTKYYLKSLAITPFTVAWNPNNRYFGLKYQLPYVIPSSGYYLRLDLTAYFRTKTNWEKEDENGTTLYGGSIYVRFKIGNKVYMNYNGLPSRWTDQIFTFTDRGGTYTGETGGYEINFYEITDLKYNLSTPVNVYAPINDREITVNLQYMYKDKSVKTWPILIPLSSGFAGGVLEFDIYNWNTSGWSNLSISSDEPSTTATKDCRITDLKLSITDSQGNEIQGQDNVYTAELNPLYENEATEITTTTGTNVDKIPCDRAAILGYKNSAYYFMQNWTRQGLTANLETLLLRSLQSNYEKPRKRFSTTINPNQLSYTTGYLTFSSQFPDDKFVIISSSIDENSPAEMQITCESIVQDNLTVSTNY